jgi:hypothetical protein
MYGCIPCWDQPMRAHLECDGVAGRKRLRVAPIFAVVP